MHGSMNIKINKQYDMSVIAMWSSHPGKARDLSFLQMSRAALSPPSLLFSEYSWLCPGRYSDRGVRLNTLKGEDSVNP